MCSIVSFRENSWNPDPDEEDEDEEFPKFIGRNGTIYLIDASNFDDVPNKFKVVLDCIEAGMLNGVIINDKDLVSIESTMVIFNHNSVEK